MIRVGTHWVHGENLDPQTRCRHWHGPADIIAVKMRCCGNYYACQDCHDALAGHAAVVWPKSQWGSKAVLCGCCQAELTIDEYMSSGYACPVCRTAFNPGCRNHCSYYFQPISEPPDLPEHEFADTRPISAENPSRGGKNQHS